MSQDIATLSVKVKGEGIELVAASLERLEKISERTARATEKIAGTSEKTNRATDRLAKGMGKLEKATDGLYKGIRRAGAMLVTYFGARAASSYIIQVTRMAGAYDMLGVSMIQVGKNAGYSKSEMLQYEQSLRKAGIAAIESRQALARMVSANIDLAKSHKLARGAQDVAVIGQINSSEAFQRLVYGIQSAQTEVLRTMGINVNFEKSYAKMAKQLGITTGELSEYARTVARTHAVEDELAKARGTYEASMTSAEKQYLSLKRHVDNYQVALGKATQPAYLKYVETQTELYERLNEAVSDPAFQSALEGLSSEIMRMYSDFVLKHAANLPEYIEKATDKLKELKDGVGKASDAIKPLLSAVGAFFSFWQSLPEYLRDPLAGGLVGGILFGKAGLLVGFGIEVVSGSVKIARKGLESLVLWWQGAKASLRGDLDYSKFLSASKEEARDLIKAAGVRRRREERGLLSLSQVENKTYSLLKKHSIDDLKTILDMEESLATTKISDERYRQLVAAAIEYRKTLGEVVKANKDVAETEEKKLEKEQRLLDFYQSYTAVKKALAQGGKETAKVTAQNTKLEMELRKARGESIDANWEVRDSIEEKIKSAKKEISTAQQAIKQYEALTKEERKNFKGNIDNARTVIKIYGPLIKSLERRIFLTDQVTEAQQRANAQAKEAARIAEQRENFGGMMGGLEDRYAQATMTEDELFERRHQLRLKSYDEEWRARKISAVQREKLYREETRVYNAELKKRKGAEEKQLTATDRMYEKMFDSLRDMNAGTIRGMLDGNLRKWSDYGKAILDIMKNTFAQIAATALQQKIILPTMVSVFGNSAIGLAAGRMIDPATQTGGGGLLSGVASLGENLVKGIEGNSITGWMANKIPGMGFLNNSLPGAAGATFGGAGIAGMIGGLGYSTIGKALGLPQGKYSGLTSGLGSALGYWGGSALGGTLAGAAAPVGAGLASAFATGGGSAAALGGAALSPIAGAAGSAGGVAAGASFGSVVPIIGTVIGAVLGGLLGSAFGKKPRTPEISIRNFGSKKGWGIDDFYQKEGWRGDVIESKYRYTPYGHAMKGNDAWAKPLHDYFEERFGVLDSALDKELGDVMDTFKFDVRVKAKDFKDKSVADIGKALSAKFMAQAGDVFIAEVLKQHGLEAKLLPASPQSTGHRKGFWGGDSIFAKALRGPVQFSGARYDTGMFDKAFFAAIAPDGDMITGLKRFDAVLDNSADAVDRLTQRIEEQGLTAVEAFNQIAVIDGIITQTNETVTALGRNSVHESLKGLISTWDGYIATMKEAGATVERVTQVEQNRNTTLGATITGMNANSIAGVLSSGGSLDQAITAGLRKQLNAQIAEIFFEDMQPHLEQAGKIFEETFDPQKVAEYLRGVGYDIGSLIQPAQKLSTAVSDAGSRAAQAADQFDQTFRGLEIRMLQAQGKLDEALYKQRENELLKIYSSYNTEQAAQLADLLKNTWVAEDQTRAEGRRNSTAQAYLAELIRGRDTLLAQQQQQESQRKAKEAQERADKLSSLHDALTTQRRAADALRSALESVKNRRDSLWTGSTSPLSISQRLESMGSKIAELFAKTKDADTETATKAMRELASKAPEYLGLQKESSESWVDYARAVAEMDGKLGSIEDAGAGQLTQAEREIERLEKVIESLNAANQQQEELAAQQQMIADNQAGRDLAWYNAEIEKLQGILDSSKGLEALMQDFAEASEAYASVAQQSLERVQALEERVAAEAAARAAAQAQAQAEAQARAYSSQQAALAAQEAAMRDVAERAKAKAEADKASKVLSDDDAAAFVTKMYTAGGYTIKDNGEYFSQWVDYVKQHGKEQAKEHWQQRGYNGDLTGFRDGGISYGPESGYRTLMHGTEAVIPLGRGVLPLEIRGLPRGGDGADMIDAVRELQSEIRQLRQDQNNLNGQVVKNTAQAAHYAEKEFVRKGRETMETD